MLDRDKEARETNFKHDDDREPQVLTEEQLEKHPHFRRQSKAYKARRNYVRDLWIYSGLLIIFMPLSVQILCLAALTFLSLSILDEEAGSEENEI